MYQDKFTKLNEITIYCKYIPIKTIKTWKKTAQSVNAYLFDMP